MKIEELYNLDTRLETREGEKLLEAARAKGVVDISILKDEEKKILLSWYKEKADQLDQALQVELIEQFIGFDMLDDNGALGYISNLDMSNRAEIGRYIGSIIKPEKYLNSFYECWYDIGLSPELMDEFTEKNKEAAIMAAPFCDLTKRKIKVKDHNDKDTKKTLFEHSFYNHDRAEKLIQALLRLNHDHPDSHSYYHIKNNFKNIYKPFLVPHMSELEEGDLLDRDFIEDFFNKDKFDFLVIERFLTREEEEKKKEIIQKIKDKNPKMNESEIIHTNPFDIVPMNYGFELSEIYDLARLRSSKNLLDNFQENKKYIKDPLKFLDSCQEKGYSVFSSIRSVGLSNKDISQFIGRVSQYGESLFYLPNLKDLEIFLEYNKTNPDKDGPDLELVFVNYFKRMIAEMGHHSYMVTNFVIRMDKMQALFTEENFKMIINAIEKEPAIWLYNLKFALKEEVLDSEKILDGILAEDGLFIDNYFRILNSFKRYAKADNKRHEEKIREKAQNIIKNSPNYLFKDDHAKVVADNFKGSEINGIIIHKLEHDPDFEFITKLLKSKNGNKYKEKCEEVALNNKFIISEASDWPSDFDVFIDLVNDDDKVVDIVIKNMEIVNLKELADNHRFVRCLVNNQEQHERFFSKMSETGWESCYANFILRIDYMIKNIKEKKKERKKEKSNLRYIISQLNSDRKWADRQQKKEINQKIKKHKEEYGRPMKEKIDHVGEKNEIESMQAFRHDVLSRLREILREDPFLIFDENISKVDSDLSMNYIDQKIEEYAELHPEILLINDYFTSGKICTGTDNRTHDGEVSNLTYERLLGEERFNELFEKHIRSIAFGKDKYGYTIYKSDQMTDEMVEKIKETNPLIDINDSEKLGNDYYRSVVEKIQDTPFYSLFKDKFEKIVAHENELYGDQYEPGRILVSPEFSKLVERTLLLNSSKLAVDNLEFINSLGTKDRDELLETFEFSAYYNLDRDMLLEFNNENISLIKEKLNKRIYEYIGRSFELEKNDSYEWNNIDIESVKALKIYYWKTCRKQPQMKKNFKNFVSHAIGGNYENWRWWGEENDKEESFQKLKENRFIPDKLDLKQYEAWINEDEYDLEEVFEFELSDVQSGIKNLLEQAVLDGHIEEDTIEINKDYLKEKRQELLEPLSEMTGKLQELKKEAISLKKRLGKNDEKVKTKDKEYNDLQKKIVEYRQSNNDEIVKINALLSLDALKNINLKNLENNTVNINNKDISFNKAISSLENVFGAEYPDFRQDIMRLKAAIIEGRNNIFGDNRISRSKIMVTDKVDLSTYIHIGEKPVSSCQHYDGYSDYNNGLLSYLTDPNVKIIQIYDDNDNIIARSIMRLLSDKDGNGVLFMERVYSSNSHRKIDEIIETFIARKAKSMDVKWCSDRVKLPDMATLYNKGSRSPYIYSDAGGGLKLGGVFKIN